MKKRIYYHHTDAGKVVYYAKYLEFLEEARTELFEKAGISLAELAKAGILFVVARQEIDYKSPAFYADVLDVDTWVSSLSDVRLEFEAEIKNQEGKLVAKAKTIMVCVDKNLKPQAIPEHVKTRIIK